MRELDRQRQWLAPSSNLSYVEEVNLRGRIHGKNRAYLANTHCFLTNPAALGRNEKFVTQKFASQDAIRFERTVRMVHMAVTWHNGHCEAQVSK